MKNKKGFTLIELIAVIVIMGIILLMVFPATSRLIRSNENKKYDTYYDAVQEELELYARTRRDELGGIKGSGCVDDKKLSDLKEYDYISEYKEEKNVTCLSPGDFTTDRLGSLGIDTSRQYVNIRIDNNKGNIDVKYSMICVKNYDDPTITSILYKKLYEKDSTCENYVPVVTNSLLNVIKDSFSVDTVGTTSYLNGNPTNNYVLYSGRLWRIINYDTTDRTIKLVMDDSVALVNYDNKDSGGGTFSNNYSLSNIYLWLKNKFLPTLRNTDKYLLDVKWNYDGVNQNVDAPIINGSTIEAKVGMINNFEYSKGSQFLNNGMSFWLISTVNGSSDSAWYVNNSGIITSSNVSNYYGVRPSIVLKPNITYVNGGNGTIDNPYKLIGDTSANIGTELNSRFPGEYVTLNGIKFRISQVDPKYTKLIALSTIPIEEDKASTIQHIVPANYNVGEGTIGFHYYDKLYSDNTFIGEYLRKWAEPFQDLLIEGDFCRMTFTKTTSQTIECPPEEVINSKVAIPKIGDMYANFANSTYWTMNRTQEDRFNVISSNNTVGEIGINDLSSILPIIVISNETKITGGNGTFNNPYTIE